jgi:hypothetical protein
MSFPLPAPPVINAADAASALCEYFLANAERGDHAANDHLVAELVDRIRARQQPPDNSSFGRQGLTSPRA